MAHSLVDDNERIELRIPSEEKAVIARAAALEHMNVTSFILRTVLPKARELVSKAEHVALSDRDMQKVLDLLEKPPFPNERLIRAASAGQTIA